MCNCMNTPIFPNTVSNFPIGTKYEVKYMHIIIFFSKSFLHLFHSIL